MTPRTASATPLTFQQEGLVMGKGNVVTLNQPARRRAPKKQNPEIVEMSAPDIYRAIGSLEAMASNLKTAVEGLSKTQGENNVLTAQIVAKLDSIGKDLHTASTTAVLAKQEADRAHARIDRLIWTATGAGTVSALIISFFSQKLATLAAGVTRMFGG